MQHTGVGNHSTSQLARVFSGPQWQTSRVGGLRFFCYIDNVNLIFFPYWALRIKKNIEMNSKTNLSFICTISLFLFGVVSFFSCGDDDVVKDNLSVEFSVGDVINDHDTVIVIGPSSYKIHYAGKVTYEAGLVLSTVMPIDEKNGNHVSYVHRFHEGTNHESWTSYSWQSFTFNHGAITPGMKETFYYTLFVKPDNEDRYYYGQTKSFVVEMK